MKSARQIAIQEIITAQAIGTQEELVDELGRRGFRATQATVSRDIKELRLQKIPMENDRYRYAMPDSIAPGHHSRYARILSECVLSVTASENIVVVKTLTASANAAAEALDKMHWPEILGTIAGDNTIMMVIRTRDEVADVVQRLQDL